MNREDIIRMARECADNCDGYGFAFYTRSLQCFAALVAAAEREDILRMSESQFFKTQAEYDDAIRARGNK